MSRYNDYDRRDDRGYGGRGDRYRDQGARIYVGNLPDDITRDELHDFVGKYGRVNDVDIKHGKTSNGTAYAFITFDDERDAEDCIRGRDGARFMDGSNSLRVRVEKAGRDRRRPERGPPRRSDNRVYVTGLPRNTSWQDLKDLFRSVADVGYANVDRDVGVVEFHDRRDLEEAIKQMDGKDFSNSYGTEKITVSDRPPAGYNGGDRYRGDARGGRDRSYSPRRRSRSRSFDGRDRRRSPPRREASPAPRDDRSVSPPRRERDEDSGRRSRSRSPPRRSSRSPPRRSPSRD